MAVKIGSARSSFGDTSAGDQSNGKEVSTQDWYLHGKGWYVYRAKDDTVREKIAVAMQLACDNDDIGYSQGTRSSLWSNVKSNGYDPSKTTKKVNTDCSALVRVCCAYAGVVLDDFITSTEGTRLTKSGQFEKLTSDKYCKSSDYLLRGDILCTRTKGHTVVVLSNGAKVTVKATTATQTTQATTMSQLKAGKWNLRTGPGTEYESICTVSSADAVTVVDTGDWKFVKAGDKTGWIGPAAFK